jgi:hypothetical protein
MGKRISLRNRNKSKRKNLRNRRSRRLRGGNTQYLSNVGYSSGYSLPFYKPYVTNIV